MSEWKTTTLGDFISLQRGHDLPSDKRRPGGIPVVGSGGITGFHDTAMMSGPGVTVGRAANIGVPTFLEEDFWPLNTTLYVTDFHGNDIQFAYYLLRTLDLTGFNSGSVQPMLNRNYVQDFPILVPDAPEQRAVAAILGALDDKIAVNDRIADASLTLGDAYFVEMLQTSTADHRTLAELDADGLIEIGAGRPRTVHEQYPSIPILRVADVLDGKIDGKIDSPAPAPVPAGFKEAVGSKVSRPGDVVLTVKGTVGRVALMPRNGPDFAYSPQLCYFRGAADSPVANSLVYFWLRSSDFWRQAEPLKSQTDMADYLSLADIQKLTIPVLDKISGRRWSRMLSGLLARLSACDEESRGLAKLRDALLPKLMSGEIRVPDAEKVVEDVT